MDLQDEILSGIWHCTHWYPNKDDIGEDMTENDMRAHRDGKKIIFESLPTSEGSYMLVRLSLNGGVATGTWHETAAPGGDFQSANYSGAGQLLVDEDNKHMTGMWAGVGYDHAASKRRVYTGRWELQYVGEQPAQV